MNLFGLSPGELLLIMMVALVVLGPEKLPETAASAGKWIREFRRATEELTAQFAAENPLAELQRAFSLTDEPVSVATVEEPTVVEEPESLAEPAATDTPLIGSPATALPQAPARRRSEYFDRPVYSLGIASMWTHGAVEERRPGRHRRSADEEPSVASEWMHGAPLPLPSAANGHNGHAPATNDVSVHSSELISPDVSTNADRTSSTAEDTSGPERLQSDAGAAGAGIGDALYPIDPATADEPGEVQSRSSEVESEERSMEEAEAVPEATDEKTNRELTTVSMVNGDGREGHGA